MIAQPNPELDAHRLFSYQPVVVQEKHVVVTVSAVSKKATGRHLVTVSATVPTDIHCEEYDEYTQKKLLLISRLLYYVYVFPKSNFNDKAQLERSRCT
jgi:hypothetical protein